MDLNAEGPAQGPTADFWAARRDEALALAKARWHLPTVLIEISAQHPLEPNGSPAHEVRARLDLGRDLYDRFVAESLEVQIYVPGSRHMHEGVTDPVGLSEAGCEYLLTAGVPGPVLHGEDLNQRYKGDAGVYGSADEAFVAASYFKDHDFGRLVTVMSPAQLMRKVLNYLAFGVYPLAHAVPTVPAFHDYVYEAMESVPRTLHDDPDLQAPDSREAEVLREGRDPRRAARTWPQSLR